MHVVWLVISHLSEAEVSEQHLAHDSVLLFEDFKGGRDDRVVWTLQGACDSVSAVLCVSHQVG